LATCLAATATGEGITFRYENLKGEVKNVHATPARCHLVKGEWSCIAWAGGLKHYRLCRMAEAKRVRQLPPGSPVSIPASEVDALLGSGFYATASSSPRDRVRVRIAVSPEAWRLLKGRRWGDNQVVDDTPENLPKGWFRLTFTTTGLTECRHWVLGMGANVRAEAPDALVEWVQEQAKQILGR
jgi:predicted DNA-binding transcriptional regulator YafY